MDLCPGIRSSSNGNEVDDNSKSGGDGISDVKIYSSINFQWIFTKFGSLVRRCHLKRHVDFQWMICNTFRDINLAVAIGISLEFLEKEDGRVSMLN